MDRRSVISKTGKGLMEATGKTRLLSRALRNILKEVEGQISIAALAAKLAKVPETELLESMKALEKEGFVRDVTPAAPAPSAPAKRSAAAKSTAASEGEDLDFTSLAAQPVPQVPDDAALRARAEAERNAKLEAAVKAKAEADAMT